MSYLNVLFKKIKRMKFSPQKYAIQDVKMQPFIDVNEIEQLLAVSQPTAQQVREVVAKSLNKERLNLQDVAILLNADDPALIEEIKDAARRLKEKVYGSRIVLFAPLYVGSYCQNNCKYCGFKASNKDAIRQTLNKQDLISNVEALEEQGHKRLILVFGEHKDYSPEFIAEAVKTVYSVKKNNGEIRRVNINAAPLEIEGFKTVHASGIGTYQIFQETYHPDAYKKYHITGKKADYNYRLTSLDRAMEAGIDDVGIGALFGLYNWKFEVMGLVRHTNHLEALYNVGPHTISFPRLQKAEGLDISEEYLVSDDDFIRIIAILRLAVPYTGMILTAREPEYVRSKVLEFGCSQIDAGTKIEIGAYASKENTETDLKKGQFQINDNRTLNEVMNELIDNDYIPSFCTACYRMERTGEHFMEFSVPGFIKRFCQPNAILTLAEYLEDYAPPSTKQNGYKLIEQQLLGIENLQQKEKIIKRLEMIKQGKRDLYF